MTAERFTCVVADDEAPIAARLARLAEEHGLEVVEVCADGTAALEAIRRHAPSLAILDIRMPGPSGLDVLARLGGMEAPPAVVLVTAYDEHAVAAFALAAVDYVLKPVSRERFGAAVERAKATVVQRGAAEQLARLRGALACPRPERITLRDGARLIQLSPTGISRLEAQDDYVLVHADGRAHLLAVTLRALEGVLPNPPFARCHRSHLVNLDRVAEAAPQGDGRLLLKLEDGATVPVSRAHAGAVRLGLSRRAAAP